MWCLALSLAHAGGGSRWRRSPSRSRASLPGTPPPGVRRRCAAAYSGIAGGRARSREAGGSREAARARRVRATPSPRRTGRARPFSDARCELHSLPPQASHKTRVFLCRCPPRTHPHTRHPSLSDAHALTKDHVGRVERQRGPRGRRLGLVGLGRQHSRRRPHRRVAGRHRFVDESLQQRGAVVRLGHEERPKGGCVGGEAPARRQWRPRRPGCFRGRSTCRRGRRRARSLGGGRGRARCLVDRFNV